MPQSFPYKIDNDKKIVYVDAAGLTLTKDLILNSAKVFKSDPLCDPEFNFIFDYSALRRIDISNKDFHEIIKAEAAEKAYVRKVALVMGKKGIEYMYSKLYTDVAQATVQHLPKVFETMDEAEQWVSDGAGC